MDLLAKENIEALASNLRLQTCNEVEFPKASLVREYLNFVVLQSTDETFLSTRRWD